MRIPAATYRLQFNPSFTFKDAQKIVSYLAELGISDLYASPIFKAREGSNHGYDVVDATQLNPALGSQNDFDNLVKDLQKLAMGWLQDIVPNHMAYDSQNPFLMDVLENGPDSEYFDYFDIDWEHPYEAIRERVLVPLLGDFYGNCLERGEIKLTYEESGLYANYYSLKVPLRIESYDQFLNHDLARLARKLGRNNPDYIKLLGVLYIIKNLPAETQAETSEASRKARKDQASFVKGLIWELYRDNETIQQFINDNINVFNGEPNNPESFNLLDNLLDQQFFRLSYWKVGAEELNYRRFFTVNELISVKIEDEKVFNQTHQFISELVKAGKFTGLRVDHIDGLYDPDAYLRRLREKMGDVYIVVEKILEPDEELPLNWQIQGTSGYEFLSYVNGVFCQNSHEQQFNNIYMRLIGSLADYEQLVVEKKRLIADKNLAGDAENLANLLKRISEKNRHGRDFTLNGLRKAILEVLVLFPVYRTYINEQGVSHRDRIYVEKTIKKAAAQNPQLVNEMELIKRFLLLEYGESLTEEDREMWLRFVMKLQQFSGPLTAKGVEDTLFYVYHRFISLNEVGSSPDEFGVTVAEFNEFNQQKFKHWRHSMNTTSTHDTKRSEDVRARLNVISEIPEEWETQIRTWMELNREYKQDNGDRVIPDSNDEYFLYQNLVGAFPLKDEEYSQFIERVKDFVVKAVREAKVHTAWLRPDTEYEDGFINFVAKIMQPSEDNQFLPKLREFQEWVANYGMFNSLGQTLLKLTAPGVPDLYQGCELWDLSLVDPDNRRPVDFELRKSYLDEMKTRAETDILGLVKELITTKKDGRIKLFLINRTLAERKEHPRVFEQGDYIPLEVTGNYQNHLVAFARRYGETEIIAIVPRFLTQIVEPGKDPLGKEIWGDTTVHIPHGAQLKWRNAFTEETLPGSDTFLVGEILQYFPVALLVGESIGGNPKLGITL
ncbi:MAG: malto-oligosyltrehalose synthase [Oscillatoria sp. PMC 1068.18]|nr:malto-oligosyltrehalose synthase [Oscillatoria sp. PMC 1076.18]MEC4990256.1 malto-oligosyltrehalose synthase [Oscillatoria sp. PMC 1068.18]